MKDYVFTGGNDGVINILNGENYTLIKRFDADLFKDSISKKIIAITVSHDLSELVVGTFGSEIYCLKNESFDQDQEMAFGEHTELSCTQLISGHYTPNPNYNQVWGLCLNPNDPKIFLTCGWDATVRVWNMDTKRMVRHINLNQDENQREIPLMPKNQADDPKSDLLDFREEA